MQKLPWSLNSKLKGSVRRSVAALSLVSISVLVPISASASSSRVSAVIQPGYIDLPKVLQIPIYGFEAEFGLADSPWSLGGLYQAHFSYSNLEPLGPIYDWRQAVAQTLWARYSFSKNEGWSLFAGAGAYEPHLTFVPASTGLNSSFGGLDPEIGGVIGISYRTSLGPFWFRFSPNVVLTQHLDQAFHYDRSGLSWIELGVRFGSMELSVDPLPRTLRAYWVF